MILPLRPMFWQIGTLCQASTCQPKGLITTKSLLIKFIYFRVTNYNNLLQSLINFSLVFRITSKAGVRSIPFQQKLQLLVSHFFRAKCVTSHETYLLATFWPITEKMFWQHREESESRATVQHSLGAIVIILQVKSNG